LTRVRAAASWSARVAPSARASKWRMTSVSEEDWNTAPSRSSSSRRASAFTMLPLWAMATGPCAGLALIGCALRTLELPPVEYRTCPMARWPGSRRRRSRLKTSATHPIAFSTWKARPSVAAMPADSWPRCCSAYSPRYATLAASEWFHTPKSPHSSWNLSSRSRAAVSADVTRKPAPPRLRALGERQVDDGCALRPHDQSLSLDATDPPPRHLELVHQPLEMPLGRGRHRDDDPRRPLAEQRDVQGHRRRQFHLHAERGRPRE